MNDFVSHGIKKKPAIIEMCRRVFNKTSDDIASCLVEGDVDGDVDEDDMDQERLMDDDLIDDLAETFGCSADEVCQEDIMVTSRRGWLLDTDGKPYCTFCGCYIREKAEDMPKRKFCGFCRNRLN